MMSCNGLSGAILIASPDGKVTYWSPAAATKFGWSETEARALGIQGLFSTAEGALGLDRASRGIEVRFKSGGAALFEAQIVSLADADGGAYGQLYVLRAMERGGQASDDSGGSPAIQGSATARQVLHQLNNVFASIHSSLDLALGTKQPPETESLLLQAQQSARKGAGIVNELWMRVREVPGLAEPKTGIADPKTAGHPAQLANKSPELLEGSERVLLAEDESSIRVLMRAVLTYRGYKVVEAVDGADAVNKYRVSGPFDLVILDMAMPKLGGREALEQIRAQDPTARALALSGTPFDKEDDPRNPAAKFDGILNKPFGNIELLQLVRRVLDHKRGADLGSEGKRVSALAFRRPSEPRARGSVNRQTEGLSHT
jgi:CheY-like chemotaxis protein